MQSKTAALNDLFDRWVATYPPDRRHEFHRDGIVDEARFLAAPHRVLLVVLEPNTKGGMYDQYLGCDLREVWRQEPQSKSFNINVGRWASVILEGRTEFWTPSPLQARDLIRQVAIMNIKKLAGSGSADYQAASDYCLRDRAFLEEQIAIIDPSLVLVAGPKVDAALRARTGRARGSAWDWKERPVIVGNHPSLRPLNAEAAFARLVELARLGGFLGHAPSPEPGARRNSDHPSK